MIKYFQNKYAMSEAGSKDLLRSILWSTIANLSYILPLIAVCIFLDEHIGENAIQSITQSQYGWLFYIGMSFLIFAIIVAIGYFQYNATYTKIYEESARTRINLAEKLRKLPLSFFERKDIADLSSIIMEDATQIEMLFSHAVPQAYASVITVLLLGIPLIFYNWKMFLAVFWVVPLASFVFILSRKYQSRIHKKHYTLRRKISDMIQEDIDSAQEIKAYNREFDFSKKINKELDKYENKLIKEELFIGSSINLAYVFLKLGLPTVIFVGAYMVFEGSLSVFSYIIFLFIASRIYNPIITVMNNLAVLLFLQVRIDRIKEMNNMPKQEGTTDFTPKNYDVEFKNVSFSYIEGVQTLNDINLVAKQGEVTALVGPSGGGKTTVAKLAARFWDVDSGKITLGGKDISEIDPETLLKSYSIVFQDVVLFNASVMENIRIGKKDADDEEVKKAAMMAHCDTFVSKLPNGYNTLIGENGERLSGGERQRISIARAILKDAPIILMDEATASLDTENETKIQAALSELIKEKTVIIIAHRMRTVIGADKIIVIKDGNVIESGSPKELQKSQGVFYSMVKSQYEI